LLVLSSLPALEAGGGPATTVQSFRPAQEPKSRGAGRLFAGHRGRTAPPLFKPGRPATPRPWPPIKPRCPRVRRRDRRVRAVR